MLATLLTQYNLDGSIVPSVAARFDDVDSYEIGRHLFTDHLPTGRDWDAYRVKGTIDHAIASAIGGMYATVLDYFAYLRRELDPRTTTDLIADWETSVGLPDGCTVNRVLTLQERRDLVVLRLSNSPTVSALQMQAVILSLTGYQSLVLARTNPANPYYSDAGRADRFIIDVFVNVDNQHDFDGGVDFDSIAPVSWAWDSGEDMLWDNGQVVGGYTETWEWGESGLILWDSGQDMSDAVFDEYEEAEFDGQPYPTIVDCIINRIKPANVIANVYYSAAQYTAAGGVA